MFGKRAKKPSQDEDFEGSEAEFTENFAAADESQDEGFSGDDWSDDAHATDDIIEPELRDRRRSPLAKVLPFAAIGILAAGGAGYYYLNFMQPGVTDPLTQPPVIAAAPSEQPAEQQMAAATSADTTAMPVVSDTSVVMPTASTTETAAATEATTETAPPVTGETADSAPSMPEPAIAQHTDPVAMASEPSPVVTAEPPVDTAEAETPAPVAVIAAAEPAPLPAPTEPTMIATTPVVSPEPVAVTPAPSMPEPAPAANDEKLADMTERMQVIEHQVADLTKALDRLAASQNSAAPVAAPVIDPEMKNTVSALQGQVRDLQNQLTTLKNARSAAPAATPANSQQPAAMPAEPRTATRTATSPRTAPAAAATSAPAPAVHWILRAAQSGEAWISRSSEGELKSVSVGDTLPGIGRITAIRQTGSGGWEVIGTDGAIRQ